MKKSIALAIAAVFGIAAVASAATLSTVTLVSNLNRPTALVSTPALPNHLFVLEKNAIIKTIDTSAGNAVATFMDIGAAVHDVSSAGDEQGLLGMAFHPNFASNRLFYVYYTSQSNQSNIVAQYTANVGLLTGDATSGVVLLTMFNVETNHNGGTIAFGPDGKLYVGTGDGGGAGDAHGSTCPNPPNCFGNAQSLTSATSSPGTNTHLLGKMLRMDVDIPAPYIPADNPNIDGSGQDLKWMYGLRNPWKWSWDRSNGDLYIADVGQNAIEEVNYIPAGTGTGRNFGWRCMEGNAGFSSPSGPNCTAGGGNLTNPILTYTHGVGNSITGGYCYRGSVIPGEYGNYFYADYGGGQIWSLKMVGGVATANTQRFTFGATTAFGQDTAGELYIVSGNGTTNGTVRKIVTTCNGAGDLNADCLKNQADIDILVSVLLDMPPDDPAMVARADVNGDVRWNGDDIAAWIAAP